MSLQGTVVTGQRPQMEMSFDKRVFHFGKEVTTTGTSLLDMLDNVPSVTADMKGNVSLRGSGAVRILIDNKLSDTAESC